MLNKAEKIVLWVVLPVVISGTIILIIESIARILL